MRVFIQNKVVSFGGSSTVKNEANQDVFFVKGKAVSPTRVKYVCDQSGNRLYKVRNKWFNFFSHYAYIYDANGNRVAKVKSPFLNVRRYEVESEMGEIVIDGDFFSLSSTIMRNGVPMGSIHREMTAETFFFGKDAFSLEGNDADIPFLIALVIAIDNITDNKVRN